MQELGGASMSTLEEQKPAGSWREKWADAGNIKFPRTQFEKMQKIKTEIGCNEWADLADDLHTLVITVLGGPKVRELIDSRRKIYKV